MLKYITLLYLLASPCLAQQQVPTVAETGLQINSVVSQWAQTLTQQSRQIEDLQKQLAAKTKELEEAKKDTK